MPQRYVDISSNDLVIAQGLSHHIKVFNLWNTGAKTSDRLSSVAPKNEQQKCQARRISPEFPSIHKLLVLSRGADTQQNSGVFFSDRPVRFTCKYYICDVNGFGESEGF